METIDKVSAYLTVGELVAQNHRAADVFDKYGIDFCCGGKQRLADVCSQKGIVPEKVIQELRLLPEEKKGTSTQAYTLWQLGSLIDYIVQTHHTYLQDELPVLSGYLRKIVSAHGDRHPELGRVEDLFLSLKEDLLAHLWKEENVLFPYIKKIVSLQKEKGTLLQTYAASPIAVMEAEHEIAGKLLKEIREMTQDFALPDDACPTYRVVFAKLIVLEKDLHTHIHLENNILFPKAIALETTLLNPHHPTDEYVI